MKKSLFAVWLPVLICLLACLLVMAGCHSKENDGPDTQPPAPPADPITVLENGGTAFTIVRGDKASSAIVNMAVELRSAFLKTCDVEFPLCDEYMYGISGGEAAIVIGETADEVTTRLKASLQYDDFVIHAENGNLYLIGGSDESTLEAVAYFIETYLSEPADKLVLQGDLHMKYEYEYDLIGLTVAGTPIASYRIVYDNRLFYAKARANDLREMILRRTGAELAVVADTEAETTYEILVGETNRTESRAVTGGFDLPNIYYRVTVSGSKLLFVNQGVRTGEAALEDLKTYFAQLSPEQCNITAENLDLSGDVRSKTDKKALVRPQGTDLRIMHSNILLQENVDNNYLPQQRAELLVDTYLVYLPDVITLNEMISGRSMNAWIRTLLADYYEFSDLSYLNLFEDPANMDENLKNRKCPTPIAYRKNAGITEMESGFSYLSDMVSWHGMAWSVFELENGYRFLAVSAHFSENKDEEKKWITTYAEDTIRAINVARKKYGDLPVVANGDWFFWQNTAPYQHMISSGFVDASETAVIKHSVGVGTFHDIGKGEQGRVEEDICFITPEWFTAQAHKNLVDIHTVNGSDHYPVLIDLSFNRRATANNILPYDDGTGSLDVKDEGAGGSGDWGLDTVAKTGKEDPQ